MRLLELTLTVAGRRWVNSLYTRDHPYATHTFPPQDVDSLLCFFSNCSQFFLRIRARFPPSAPLRAAPPEQLAVSGHVAALNVHRFFFNFLFLFSGFPALPREFEPRYVELLFYCCLCARQYASNRLFKVIFVCSTSNDNHNDATS